MEINKIYNENNLVTMARMPDNFIDLTVTSPPYDNLRDYKGFDFDFENVAKELFRVTKKSGVVVWVVGDATINGSETGTSFKQALYFMECGFNLHDTMIYLKTSYLPAGGAKRYYGEFEYMFVFCKCEIEKFNPIKSIRSSLKRRMNENSNYDFRKKDGTRTDAKNLKQIPEKINGNVFKYLNGFSSTVDNISFEHPATFPEDLAKDHIYTWSNENDLIYDPFMGSGTTAKMAHIYKRNWIGSEISKEYCDIAYKRLKPYLTQTTLF